jgi:hypothetical protein
MRDTYRELSTNSDLTNYPRTVIKYALDDAERYAALNPKIRGQLGLSVLNSSCTYDSAFILALLFA